MQPLCARFRRLECQRLQHMRKEERTPLLGLFGTLPDGSQVEIFTLKSEQVEARVMSWGGRLVSVKTKDRNGEMAHISLGYDTLEEWLRDTSS